MIDIVLVTMLSCLGTVHEGPDRPWTERDAQALKRAAEVCAKRYAPRSPCLVKFIRYKEQGRYSAICGRKR